MTTATLTQETVYETEETRMIRDQLRRFVREEVMPHGEAWEAEGKVPREALRKLGEMGMLGMRVPEEYGGSDLNSFASVILAEELSHCTFAGFTVTVLVHTDMAAPHLVKYGSDELKAKYIPKFVTGELITAIGVTEPDAGSDVAGMRTRAVRDGDDYVINGSKMFITNGVYGDVYFVAAKTDSDAPGSKGITMFLIEKDTPGFSVSRKLDKHGWLCSDTAELVFEDCRVPAANIVGEANRGFYQVMKNFQTERLVLGAMCVGEATKAIDITLEHVRTRKAFGAPLWDKQAIRQRLAMVAAKVEAGRHMLYHTAWLDSQGQDCVREVSMVKAYCAEVLQEAVYECVQFHGGMGYMRESAIERMSRDARVQPIGGGATEVMLEEIAKRL